MGGGAAVVRTVRGAVSVCPLGVFGQDANLVGKFYFVVIGMIK